jgi:hypothetical protein
MSSSIKRLSLYLLLFQGILLCVLYIYGHQVPTVRIDGIVTGKLTYSDRPTYRLALKRTDVYEGYPYELRVFAVYKNTKDCIIEIKSIAGGKPVDLRVYVSEERWRRYRVGDHLRVHPDSVRFFDNQHKFIGWDIQITGIWYEPYRTDIQMQLEEELNLIAEAYYE